MKNNHSKNLFNVHVKKIKISPKNDYDMDL